MKNKGLLPILSFILLLSSCKKTLDTIINHGLVTAPHGAFYKYTIREGQHYADTNPFQVVAYEELKFKVRFDSTAIYQTIDPANQEDINKLYGFSDNNTAHQQFSARFGWNWARGALRLYAYVYDNGIRSSGEIDSINIGTEYDCSIKIVAGKYIFSLNEKSIEMPRTSTTSKAEGYKLYPYFGGDETAPHDINIWIAEP